jgi:hypothetical protein
MVVLVALSQIAEPPTLCLAPSTLIDLSSSDFPSDRKMRIICSGKKEAVALLTSTPLD